uniref:receptor-transporting protein 3-like n=1 Tax=Semicossyphus pulcher TaxID=241346 RepID=UPI0037E97101
MKHPLVDKPRSAVRVLFPLQSPASLTLTNTDRMAEAEWTSIFQIQANSLKEEDSWCLEFDNSLVPNSPKRGWEEYIRKTAAQFRCSKCKRRWPSNHVMVVFHMKLTDGQGVVKVRRFRQDCKKCNEAPMEEPSIDAEHIDVLMENLVKKIRIKCYHEKLDRGDRHFTKYDSRSQHEPTHCEGCKHGICSLDLKLKLLSLS